MSLTRNLSSAVLMAGCALLLTSCAGNETARSAAPASSASPAPAGATPSSSGAAASPVSPEASATGSTMSSQSGGTAGEGYVSRAPGEQGQADGPAMAQPPKGSTSLCIQNIWSGITPSVQFTSQGTLVVSDDGPLKFGATACATGSDTKSFHLQGWVTLPEPYASYRFAADTPYFSSMYDPKAYLWQNTICINSDGYSVGDRRTWDDGLVRFVMVREPDFGGTVFRLTIDRSQKPSTDGKPAPCRA